MNGKWYEPPIQSARRGTATKGRSSRDIASALLIAGAERPELFLVAQRRSPRNVVAPRSVGAAGVRHGHAAGALPVVWQVKGLARLAEGEADRRSREESVDRGLDDVRELLALHLVDCARRRDPANEQALPAAVRQIDRRRPGATVEVDPDARDDDGEIPRRRDDLADVDPGNELIRGRDRQPAEQLAERYLERGRGAGLAGDGDFDAPRRVVSAHLPRRCRDEQRPQQHDQVGPPHRRRTLSRTANLSQRVRARVGRRTSFINRPEA